MELKETNIIRQYIQRQFQSHLYGIESQTGGTPG